MALRFNAPPGWPPMPPGWLPPPDWKPDPTWPAPPQGWLFVIDDLAPAADQQELRVQADHVDETFAGVSGEGTTPGTLRRAIRRLRGRTLVLAAVLLVAITGMGVGLSSLNSEPQRPPEPGQFAPRPSPTATQPPTLMT